MDMGFGKIAIAAPICSVAEADAVLKSGATEVYCGALFDDWWHTYGNADIISRRQGRHSHISTPQELTEIIHLVTAAASTVTLTVNARYSLQQENKVLDLIQKWEDLGGHAVMVSDPGLILALQKRNSRLKCHLSILAGVYNSVSARFFHEMGVTRLVLPRELSLRDIAALVQAGPPQMEYEAIVFNQKCPFIDGMCQFYHELSLPTGVPVDFSYQQPGDTGIPEVRVFDPEYEGHGCQLPWQTLTGPVGLPRQDDLHSPPCAACVLPELVRAGVTCFKIAGRAYPLEMNLNAIIFLRSAMAIWKGNETDGAKRKAIKELYQVSFAHPCAGRCYYGFQE